MKLAIITIILIEITIAVVWLYRPTYPTAQVTARPLQPISSRIVGVNLMVEPRIPDAARSNYCTLHRRLRVEEAVGLTYGTRLPDATYYAHQGAQQTWFPNAWSSVHAGCVRYTATQTLVKYCPECRLAERRWERVHE